MIMFKKLFGSIMDSFLTQEVHFVWIVWLEWQFLNLYLLGLICCYV